MRWEDNRAETTAWPSGCVEDQQTVRGTVFQTLECQLPWSGAKERRSNWCRISTFTQADLPVERPSPWGGTGCSGRRLRQNRNRPSTIRTCSQRLESYRRTMVSVRPNRRGGAVAGREKKGDLTYRSAPAARSSRRGSAWACHGTTPPERPGLLLRNPVRSSGRDILRPGRVPVENSGLLRTEALVRNAKGRRPRPSSACGRARHGQVSFDGVTWRGCRGLAGRFSACLSPVGICRPRWRASRSATAACRHSWPSPRQGG